MDTVLFVSARSAGRSGMAEAAFNRMASALPFRALSAGTSPADHAEPVVVAAMAEIGMERTAASPRLLTRDMIQLARRTICVGGAEETCAVVGGEVEYWGLPDPAGKPIEAVRPIRDEIVRRTLVLLAELTATQGPTGSEMSEPCACNLAVFSRDESTLHSKILNELRRRCSAEQAQEDGVLLQFPGDASTSQLLLEWILLERRCCSFARFQIELASNNGLAARVTAPPGAAAILRGFAVTAASQ
ncbi:MAG TPA: hypothetical protein VGS41_11690 [Chthonomonadales bacterium]|nr:hypothetical protein [Chthonomonadales bacterium]